MVRRYYNLPSLTALATFESAARHMSLKRAAAELNVTPGAVSRQIKALEEEAGAPLFVREQNNLHLTAEGGELYAVLARGFSKASEAFHHIRTGNAQASVTLACSSAFATLWLMPRIGAFWRGNDDVSLNHLISDNARDYRRAEVDLRVRYGSGVWPDEAAVELFRERIYLVCGPDYANAHPDVAHRDVAGLDLLHVEGVDPEWTNWEEFLYRAGVEHGPLLGRRFNNFAVLMQAAMDNQGVALGWERLIRPMLADGRLKRITGLEVDAPGAYYVTWNRNRALSAGAEKLRAWLTAEAERS